MPPEPNPQTDPPATPPPVTDPPADPPKDPPKAADPPANGKWREGIEDEKLRQFAERFTGPTDAVKFAFDARQKLSKAIVPLGKDATDDDRANFRKVLGIPDNVDGYGYTRPELPEALKLDEAGEAREKRFLEEAHKLNLTPEQAAGVMNIYYQDLIDHNKMFGDTLTKGRETAEAALRKEWGDDYDANAAMAHAAATQYGGEDFLQFLTDVTVDGVQLSNHPAFIKAFATVGRHMGEHGMPMPLGEADRETLEEQVATVRAKKAEALSKGDRQLAAQLDEQERGLYDKIYGTGPVVGSEGRTV